VSEPLLTVDLGNSRCKLRLWTPAGESLGGLDLTLARDGSADWLEPGLTWLRGARRAAAGACCAVAAPALEQLVRVRLGPLVGEGRLRAPEAGLVLDLESAHTVGSDRLFAARGALEHARASALVVDAGTALTVDALELRGERGRFRGGAIAAGPTLLARALSEHAARLPRIEPRPGAAALGRDTQAALQAGVGVGFRGAARELVEALARESGLHAAPVYLTGGARAFLLEPRPFVERRIEVVPDLVHLGLLAALRADLVRP
jgi:pantothenate kinase type III